MILGKKKQDPPKKKQKKKKQNGNANKKAFYTLIHQAPITTAADDILKYIYCIFQRIWLIVLGFNDTSILVGHFVLSPRKGEKTDRTGDKRDGQGRKINERQ